MKLDRKNLGRRATGLLLAAVLCSGLMGCGETAAAAVTAAPADKVLPEETVLKPTVAAVTESTDRGEAGETMHATAQTEAPAVLTAAPAPEITPAMQEVLSHYEMLLGLDHYGVFIHRYDDLPYVEDVLAYHAYAMEPEARDGNFFGDTGPHTVRLSYAVQDLDGDSRPELVIGEKTDQEPVEILRVFCENGQKMESLWQKHGFYLADNTVLSVDREGAVTAAEQYGGGQKKPVSGFSMGIPEGYHSFQQTLQKHGGPVKISFWTAFSASAASGQPENYSSAGSFEEIEQVYSSLQNLGLQPADSDRQYEEVIGSFMLERLRRGTLDVGSPCYLLKYRGDIDLDGREDLLIGWGQREDVVELLAMYTESGGRIQTVPGEEVLTWGYEIPCVGPRSPYDPWTVLCQWK